MVIKPLRKVVFVFAFVLLLSAFVNAQDANASDRKIVNAPAVTLPDAAKSEHLHGTMLAEVKVDDRGRVTDVTQVVGPDWTCPNYESPGLTALRKYVEKQAETVSFEPKSKDSKVDEPTHWVEFKFVDPTPPDSGKVGVKVISPGRKPVNGGVLNGKALELVQPRYPEAARAMKASGVVVIKVLISEKGNVISAEVDSGHPLLSAVSRAAACTSRFSPTTLEGGPVKVTGIIRYHFVP